MARTNESRAVDRNAESERGLPYVDQRDVTPYEVHECCGIDEKICTFF